jgi:hypothetical protein
LPKNLNVTREIVELDSVSVCVFSVSVIEGAYRVQTKSFLELSKIVRPSFVSIIKAEKLEEEREKERSREKEKERRRLKSDCKSLQRNDPQHGEMIFFLSLTSFAILLLRVKAIGS